MKLRVRGSTLRLRLTQGEVARVGQGDGVEDAIDFAPGARLVYAIGTGGDRVRATYAADRIHVEVPLAIARAWSEGDDVAIEAQQPASPGVVLSILIEKDFACLTKRGGDDDADTFPNPHETC